MKAIKLLITTTLLTTLILSSCSKDNEDNFTASASDIISTIDENPTSGTTIGTVATNLTGSLNYSITSQSMPNSFSINNTTGVVTVNEPLNFDFETSPTLTATVTVTNSTETVMSMIDVSLNDVDDIASFLSTSRADYNAASDGEWVIITESEYNSLAISLNQITKGAMNDTAYNEGPISITGIYTLANNNGFTVPSGSFVFAVRYNLFEAASGATIKLKQSSTSISEGYSDLGASINSFDQGNNYAVLKGSNSATTSTGHLAIFDSSGHIGYRSVNGNSLQYQGGDSNDLPSTQNGGTIYYQTLSSTQKQWD